MYYSDYLTGFSKRKEERRRFGLNMGAYKERKAQLEIKKQVTIMIKLKLPTIRRMIKMK